MYNLTQNAVNELTEIRNRCITAGTKKERAKAVRELLPFLPLIKKCEYPKREGLTLDGWCKNYLGVPLSTLHSSRRNEVLETFGFLKYIFPRGQDTQPEPTHDETGAL